MISEPTLRHFIYLLRWVDGDDKGARDERERVFLDQLNAALADIYALANMGQPPAVPAPLPQDRLVGERIVTTDWLTGPSGGFAHEARTHGDVFTLHLAHYRKGKHPPDVFREMKAEMEWHRQAGVNLVGESWYAQGIVSQEQMDGVAGAALSALGGDSGDGLVQASLSWGRLYRCDGIPHRAVLVYTGSEGEDQSSGFLDLVAVPLELYTHLSEFQFRKYEDEIRPHADARELKLRGVIEGVRGADDDLKSVQAKLVTLTDLTREYAESVGRVKACLQSIAVNRQNLEDVLSRTFAERDRDVFRRPLDWARLWERQLGSDLVYQEVEQNKALVALQTLQTQVEIRRAEIEGQTNFWLFLIGAVLTVGQLVGEDMADWLSNWLPFQVGVTLIRVVLIVPLALWVLVAWRWRSRRRRNQNSP